MSAAYLLLVIVGAFFITVLVRRWQIQSSLVIVVLAGAVSFIPDLPRLEVDPEIILSVVMPPLLYSAVVNFSPVRFMDNIRPILGLGVGLVLLTAVGIGFLTSWLIPSIGLAGAFVLAAIVSPPDSVTTVSHGKEIGLPRRVIDILTGESLVNDAAALVILAIALAAVDGDTTFIANPLFFFGYSAIVGVVLGLVLGMIMAVLRARLLDPPLETAINVLLPFAAFLVAEELHASGVLAVVFAGFTVSAQTSFADRRVASPVGHLTRLTERQLWPVLSMLMEAFVFAYIGLQLRFVVDDLRAGDRSPLTVFGFSMVILIAVMALRVGGVFALFGYWALRARMNPKPATAESATSTAAAPASASAAASAPALYEPVQPTRGRPDRDNFGAIRPQRGGQGQNRDQFATTRQAQRQLDREAFASARQTGSRPSREEIARFRQTRGRIAREEFARNWSQRQDVGREYGLPMPWQPFSEEIAIAAAAIPNLRDESRQRKRKRLMSDEFTMLNWKETLLVSWTGMRGIVTLAAAASVPFVTAEGTPFPDRATIQATAFVVAIGTLLIQGLTLPWLGRQLQIDISLDEVREKEHLATAEAAIADLPTDSEGVIDFAEARFTLIDGLVEGRINDEAVSTMIHRLDLQQAAYETVHESSLEPTAIAE